MRAETVRRDRRRPTSMFTDDLATPTRVETLIELIRSDESRRWGSEALGQLLQPDTLPDVKASRPQATRMLKAATELGLIKVTDAGNVVLTARGDPRSTRDLVRAAIDDKVLASTEVEPFFAPFYSFVLGLGKLVRRVVPTRSGSRTSRQHTQRLRGEINSTRTN